MGHGKRHRLRTLTKAVRALEDAEKRAQDGERKAKERIEAYEMWTALLAETEPTQRETLVEAAIQHASRPATD